MVLRKKPELPLYPVFEDMWDYIAKDKRPLILYGMGNGADKFIDKLTECGLKFTDICASDEYVRGHSFRGIRVKTLSEIDELYGDCILVLTFGSSNIRTVEMLWELRSKRFVITPDMPIAGSQYFTKEYYNERYSEIEAAFRGLCDDWSKHIFECCVRYKLTGNMYYLFDGYNFTDELYNLIGEAPRVAVDIGAYDGDTVKELLSYYPGVEKIYAVEPDGRNFKKLKKYADSVEAGPQIICKNVAAWNDSCSGTLMSSGNRNSTVTATASYQNREQSVELMRMDDLISERVDFMKFDVEGAEMEALEGCSKIIERDYPTLFISAYHRAGDLFEIQNALAARYPEYEFYLRRNLSVPAWDITLIAKRRRNESQTRADKT